MEKKYCLAFKLPGTTIIVPTPENVKTFKITEFTGGWWNSPNNDWLGTYTKKGDSYYEHTENERCYLMYEENVYEAARMVIN